MSDDRIATTDSVERWRAIWAARKLPRLEGTDPLPKLIRANGFDTRFGGYTLAQWMELTAAIVAELGVAKKTRVFEVGCGSGALLLALQRATGCAIEGIDYSPALLALAREYVPSGRFELSEACAFEILAGSCDVAISHSVFQYFPNCDYAWAVLKRMVRALDQGGRIALLDINDRATESAYHAARRKAYDDPRQYEQDYLGLPHLFFERSEIEANLRELGLTGVRYFPHAVPQYWNAEFRFNVQATKP